MEWLEFVDGLAFETRGRHLLVWSEPVRAKDLMMLVDALMGFLDDVPRLTWSEYGTGQPAGREERSAP
jgi:hypothetical protein